MGKFYVYREGVLLRIGECPDGHENEQAGEGVEIGLGIPPDDLKWPSPPDPHYSLVRKMAYPSIGDQLDALFKAGVFPPGMAAKIQEIKDKYPKV